MILIFATSLFLWSSATPSAAPQVACELLTQAQINQATSSTVGAGTSTFEVRVYGFDLAEAKVVAKTLAAAAAGKF